MTIEVLAERGVPRRAIARTLGVAESSVRYRLTRAASGAVDGRSRQPFAAAPWAEAIAVWMAEHEGAGRGRNLAALHAWLVAEQQIRHGADDRRRDESDDGKDKAIGHAAR